MSSAAYGPRWEAWQAELATTSRWHIHRRSGDRAHDVHLHHPQLVADAVGCLLDEVGRRAAAGVPTP